MPFTQDGGYTDTQDPNGGGSTSTGGGYDVTQQPWYQQIANAYQQYLGRTPSQAEVLSQVGGGQNVAPSNIAWAIQQIQTSPEAQAFANKPKQNATTPPPPPPPTEGPGGGTPPPTTPTTQTPPDIYNGPLTKPYAGTFTPPATVDLGGPSGINYIPSTPTFTGPNAPPPVPTAPAFQAPSVADVLKDPGYQFRVQQGDQGLQNWAAARGTLNDSSTANALIDYNQNAASQEYASAFDRALNTYGTNLQSQYLLPYQANVANWQTAIVNPMMTAYSTQAAAGSNQNALNYQNSWNQFLNDQNQYYNWQNNTWNKLFQAATA